MGTSPLSLLKRFFIVVFLISSVGFAYDLPGSAEKPLNDENVQALQKISRGVSSIAKHSEKAVVFVSVYKTVRGLPPGMIDPFEFFFGPQGPGGRGGRGGNNNGQPRQERREEGLGSGFIVDLAQGYIMTNNHVIQDADEIQLKLANGDTQEAKIIGRDPNTDIAIVQINDKNFNRNGLSQLVLGNSDETSVGDFVVAVGAPYGLKASVSFGIVSALGRGNLQITAMGNFIQTDAAINPGNSGGPLLSTSGQVIGINTAIYSRSGGYNGIGFAVPSNLARRIADQLISKGKVARGYIGVGLQPIDSELHKGLGLGKDVIGSLVAKIVEDGPADKGGVQPGDVIVSINKQLLKNESEVTSIIGLMEPGATAELGIIRNGKSLTLNVKVKEYPGDEVASKAKEKSSEAHAFGLALQKLTSANREQYNLTSKTGLVVTNVQTGSEGERAGLQPGDLILQVNGKAVTEVSQFKSLAGTGQRAVLRVERDGQFFFTPLRTK
jgi:serine protease Do